MYSKFRNSNVSIIALCKGIFSALGADETDNEFREKVWAETGIGAVNDDSYCMFFAMFAEGFMPNDFNRKDSWGRKGMKLLVETMPVTLEAFAFVLYVNNYSKLKTEYWDKLVGTEDSTLSTVSNDSRKPLFTREGRGAVKFGGWSNEGVEFYNRVFRVLKLQRSGGEYRRKRLVFEERVQSIATDLIRGKKRKVSSTIVVENELGNLSAMLAHRT